VKDLAHRNVDLVGIDTNDVRSEAMRFLDSARIRLRSGFDADGRVAEAFHLYGLPAAVVVTANGLIAAHSVGPVGTTTLVAALRRAGAR
jgi:hypothetical protein